MGSLHPPGQAPSQTASVESGRRGHAGQGSTAGGGGPKPRSGCRHHLCPPSPQGRAPQPQSPVRKTPAQPPALQQSPQSDPRLQQASADPARPPPTSPVCGHVSTQACPVAVQGADHRAAGAPEPLPRIHSALKHAPWSRANCFGFHNQDFSWGSLWPPSHRHNPG